MAATDNSRTAFPAVNSGILDMPKNVARKLIEAQSSMLSE